MTTRLTGVAISPKAIKLPATERADAITAPKDRTIPEPSPASSVEPGDSAGSELTANTQRNKCTGRMPAISRVTLHLTDRPKPGCPNHANPAHTTKSRAR